MSLDAATAGELLKGIDSQAAQDALLALDQVERFGCALGGEVVVPDQLRDSVHHVDPELAPGQREPARLNAEGFPGLEGQERPIQRDRLAGERLREALVG